MLKTGREKRTEEFGKIDGSDFERTKVRPTGQILDYMDIGGRAMQE
jgi:hypothetical protein